MLRSKCYAFFKPRNHQDKFAHACQKGSLAKVKALYKNGVDINENYHIDYQGVPYHLSSLAIASLCGQAEIVSFLLSKGAMIHLEHYRDKLMSPFYIACDQGYRHIASIILNYDFHHCSNDFTIFPEEVLSALYQAIEKNDLHTIQFLIKDVIKKHGDSLGVGINTYYQDMTATQYAYHFGESHQKIYHYLIDHHGILSKGMLPKTP